MGGRLSLESRFPSFEEAIDVADEMRQRRHTRGKTLAMRAIAALLIVAAICIGGFPAMLQYRSARDLSGTSVRSAQTVAGWPYPQADDAFAAAQDYNKRLAQSGQPILGEAKDPFADVRGGSRASVSDSGESDNEAGESGPQLSDSGESDNQSGAGTGADAGSADAGSASASSADAEYRSLLDSGGGVMGTIRISKISVRLPIYHGTSESALAGIHKFTIVVRTDPEKIEKLARQVEKRIDVLKVFVFTSDEVVQQEIALYKVTRSRSVERLVRQHNVRILEIDDDYIVVEKTGHKAETKELFRLLQPYGVQQFVRSGIVAIIKSRRELLNEYLEELERSRRQTNSNHF